VPITSYTNEISPDGSFSYSFTSADGQAQQAQGYLKNPGVKDLEAQVVQGSYSYTSPEGKPITVNYIADENGLYLVFAHLKEKFKLKANIFSKGFRAEGAHLPTPPPIPEAIQKSLQLIARTQNIQPGFNNQFNQNNLYQNQQFQNQQFQNPQYTGQQNYNKFG
jgi:hypothetical protein